MQANSKKIIVLVSNDLSTDMRVYKTCNSLHNAGFSILLAGRKRKNSRPIEDRKYPCKRFNMLFEKGVLFYFIMQVRFALLLFFHSFDAVYANDLDTLLPAAIIGKLKGKKVIFDSHEYFTEVPELAHSPIKKKIWKWVEKQCVPLCDVCITVNHSIAKLFNHEYNNKWLVLRNVPEKLNLNAAKSRKELGMPEDKFIFILQGSGINIQRGAEEMAEAIKNSDSNVMLYIIGGGDVIPYLKQYVNNHHLQHKIIMLDKMPYQQMIEFTANSNCGVSLDKDTNINYRYSLPNKLFDYLMAGIPVLAGKLVEVEKIITQNHCGWLLQNINEKELSHLIKQIINNPNDYQLKKQNAEKAGKTMSWNIEFEPVINQIKKITG